MSLKDFKKSIEQNDICSGGQIFCDPVGFISRQYINKIGNVLHKDIIYVQSLNEVCVQTNLFGKIVFPEIRVFVTKEITNPIKLEDYCYVICSSCKNNDYLEIPKLEKWQLIDYLSYGASDVIPKSDLEALCEACNSDIYLLDLELSKFKIFDKNFKQSMFNNLLENNQLRKSYVENIFDFTNALLDRDISTLVKIYSSMSNYDIEPLGVVTIMYTQLKRIILVGFNKNPTEQNTGLSSKQIYAIRKNLYKYDSKHVLDCFRCVCEAEKLLKEGLLNNSQLLDYVVVNLLK